MARIVALFSELDPLEEARSALEAAGFGDDVQWMIDQSKLDEAQRPPTASGARVDGTLLSFGRTTPAGAAGPLDDLGLAEEEADFLKDSVVDGGRVLVVDSDRPAEAAEILRSHAQRVVETG